MINSLWRAHDARVKRLSTTLYVYSFLDQFVLLYPVYALLFADSGLSVAEISSLFVIWSLTGLLLEVPSGVWADVLSRRLLLVAGPLLSAAGFALWTAVPGYWAFAAGFVLWGVCGALQSGALEALVYDELDHQGAAERYATVMGRARAAGLCAVAAAMAVAAPVSAAGGYPAVGVASVFACVLCAAAGLTFPEHRGRDGGGEHAGHVATLRAGLAEARGDRRVRRALLVVPAVTALWGALDEYVSLLADGTGVATSAVPLLVLLVWAGATLGGLLAPVGERLRPRVFAATVAVAALAMAAGALTRAPAGFVLLAVAFCGFQLATVVVDARLQERITGAGRATVTSLAGLGTEVATVLVYGAYAAAAGFAGHHVIFAVFAVPYLAVAVLLARE